MTRATRLTALFALIYAICHAIALSTGTSIPLSASFARTALNAVLWFAITPWMLGAVRRFARPGAWCIMWQVLVILCAAVGAGVLQANAAARLGIRDPVPALAGVFYYLDVNLAAAVLAAVVLELLAQNRALVARDRWLLALDSRLSDARCRFLALQLQPHFLFNALNMVVALAADAPREASRMLRNLRTLLVATASRSRMPWISLAEEVDVLDAYLAILGARHADALRVERHVDPRALAACVPPLMLQPLLENAIRHGLLAGMQPAVVGLTIGVDDDGRVRITVSNPLATPASRAPGLGIGLRNTRERLARFFRDDFALTLDVEADRAVLTVVMPRRTRDVMPDPVSSNDGAASLDARPATSGQSRLSQLVESPPVWIIAIGIVLFWTSAWVFWAYQMYFYSLVRGWQSTSVFYGSWADLVSAVAWIGLTPVVLTLGTLLPIRGRHWVMRAVAHAVLSFIVSLLQVRIIMASGQLGSRTLFHQANFNPIALNSVIYFLIIALTHYRAAFKWFQERETAERRLDAELAQARWHALAMESQPALIATALERIAALMDAEPDVAEEEVLELADALRLLLQSSERESVGPREALETLDAAVSLRRAARGDAPHVAVATPLDEHIRVAPSELIAQMHAMVMLPGVLDIVVDSLGDGFTGACLRVTALPGGASFVLHDLTRGARAVLFGASDGERATRSVPHAAAPYRDLTAGSARMV